MELVGVNVRLAVGLQSLDFKLHLHALVLFWLETSFIIQLLSTKNIANCSLL